MTVWSHSVGAFLQVLCGKCMTWWPMRKATVETVCSWMLMGKISCVCSMRKVTIFSTRQFESDF